MTGLSPALLPLRARFIDMNLSRADELLHLRQRIAAGQDAIRALLAIGDIAHKICGVAGTLGFERIGQLSFDLDQSIIALRNRQTDFVSAWRKSQPVLDALIAALRGSAPPADGDGGAAAQARG